jgi:hypothetical protein
MTGGLVRRCPAIPCDDCLAYNSQPVLDAHSDLMSPTADVGASNASRLELLFLGVGSVMSNNLRMEAKFWRVRPLAPDSSQLLES